MVVDDRCMNRGVKMESILTARSALIYVHVGESLAFGIFSWDLGCGVLCGGVNSIPVSDV